MKTLILLFITINFTWSQTMLKGIVQDDAGKPLSFANVLLLKSSDSSFVKGGLSAENGNYFIENVKSGKYQIMASAVGFNKSKSAIFEVLATEKTMSIPAIIATESSQQLNAVEVIAKKPLFEQQIDKLVINVENSITSAGGTALDILQRSPGVSVNQQDNSLSMSGKTGVLVMINGKLSRLPTAAVVQMLGGMASDNIEKIELITNPSAKYDAEGDAGMINIVLKKNKNFGTNGSYSLSGGYGFTPKATATLNLNHRTDKLSIFGDYSYVYEATDTEFDIDRTVLIQKLPNRYITNSSRDGIRMVNNAKIGLDFLVSKKTTMGVLFSGFTNKWEMDGLYNTTVEVSKQTAALTKMVIFEQNIWNSFAANYNLKHSISKTQELTFDVDYLLFNNSNPITFNNQYNFISEGNKTTDRVDITKKTPINIWVARGDYSQNLGKNSRLEVGVKGNFSLLTNTVNVKRLVQTAWQNEARLSSNYDLRDDIGAAYVNFNTKLNAKTKLQAGLRTEYTHTELGEPTKELIINRKFWNVFPTLFLSKDIDKDNSYQVSYGRRITRPTYNRLAPFVFFNDPYSFIQGNITLKPTISDALQIGYKYKSNYLFTLRLSNDKNVISDFQARVDTSDNKTYLTPINVDNTNTAALVISFPLKITRWWQIQNNLTGIYQQLETQYEGIGINKNKWNGQFFTSNTFLLPNGFSAEFTANYQSPVLNGVAKQWASGQISVGFQKKLQHEKGILRININDIFWNNIRVLEYNVPALNIEQRYTLRFSEPRVVRLTYSRNFGNKNVKAASQRVNSEEEKKRVGVN
jgi:hypothetical protein